MARLSKRRFFQFAVSLVEDGDVAGMEAFLQAHAEHAETLLFGVRRGPSGGEYSVLRYATWLCQFDFHRSAREVVRWLLTRGHEPDMWTALALEDVDALDAFLAEDPSRSRALHPLFQTSALSMASVAVRPVLLRHGADDGSIEVALLLGDEARASSMVAADPSLVTTDLLIAACCGGHDGFALALIDAGADPLGADDEGMFPLVMAANWGCVETTRKLLELGEDVNRRAGTFTALSMVVSRSGHGDVEKLTAIARMLVDAGATTRHQVDGKSLRKWCDERGLHEVRALLTR